jgi:hypothetical protein
MSFFSGRLRYDEADAVALNKYKFVDENFGDLYEYNFD